MIEAVRKNNSSIMKILLDDGRINPAIGNDQPIILASKLGFTKIVEILLEDKRVNPNAQNGNAIISAIDKRHIDVVRILMNKNVDPTMFNNRGYPVSIAAYKGYPEILKILLKDPRIDPTVDDNGLILVAAEDGNIEIVKLLLKDPRIISATDALEGAIKYRHRDVIELLLQSPKVNPPINNNYLLFLGSKPGGLDILELLLRHPKIDVFNNTLTKDLNLYPNVKKYIKDSLNGLIAMQYLYDMNTTKNIYRDKMENDQNIIGLYYKFLRYIIRKKPTLIMALKNLTKLIQVIIINETRSIIYNAALSVLNITNYSSSDSAYFFAFRGFLMLSYIPNKYPDILKILENEGANKQSLYMTAKLLGAQLGLNKLIDSGLTISDELKQKILVLSNINLLDLVD
jgi:ankyrin repeat protein